MSEKFKQHFSPPHYTTTYYGGPSVYHEQAPSTYDYYYPNSVSQYQWLYGQGSGQLSYSPLMSYQEQAQEIPLQYQRTQHTQWQQYESPHCYFNSYSDYGYLNLLQQQERALREQIAYEQANFQQFPTSPYIISSDGQHMRNRLLSRRLAKKTAPEHIVDSKNPEDSILSPVYYMIIDFREHAEPSEPSKPVSSILTESPVANRGTSSDSEEVSGAKLTEVSNIFSKAKCQARSEAWFDPGSPWNPFSKTTRRNKSYAKEQLREAESTIIESILITCEAGHVKKAKNATPTQRQFNISMTNNYSNSNELD
ncbi:hypothetical protein BPAE_0049g00430 [Botrytis paeoniae]|uniref:Uncharacterized protein n=1 Tax=Botrytis paeoniae TaxID=278948 RepID=A0A4Z1FQP0_9HELO|nr:hypothetical protein BPAE_0049g00430 [Botrytis paeoniae]